MNKKFAELTVRKSEDYYNKVVKSLEDAGFLLVLDLETTTERCYIVAESEETGSDGKH
jgi:poly-D-alanine transfer protein DltD